MPQPTTVGFLLIPGFALMSYAAAVEPLRAANQLSGKTLYRWWHAAPGRGPVAASNGVAIIPDFTPRDAAAAELVFVCAGGNPATFDDPVTFAWLRRLARQGVTIGGISGGPYVLARAGLLDGRRATLHWEHAAAFHEAFPEVDVVPSLFVLDGDRITCSGGVSALDMMVALIARDHGHDLAAAVGEWFLLTHIREGMGPQRMDLRHRLGVSDESLLAVLRAMEANLETPESPRATSRGLPASRFASSNGYFRGRHGGRRSTPTISRFASTAPASFSARPSLPVLDVALATGFGSASQFSRAFARSLASRRAGSGGSQRCRADQPECVIRRCPGAVTTAVYASPTRAAYSPLYVSRSTFFWTLPMAFRGRSSTNITRFGSLNFASRPSRAASTAASSSALSFATTTAVTPSPKSACGRPITARFDHAGDGVDLALDLLRVDVEAAGDDEVLAAADDRDVAVVADQPEVAGDEEAVGAELGRGLLRHPPVALEDVRPLHLDHADLALRQRRAGLGVGDPQPRRRAAAGRPCRRSASPS